MFQGTDSVFCLFVFGCKNDGKKSVSEAAASSAPSYLASGSE